MTTDNFKGWPLIRNSLLLLMLGMMAGCGNHGLSTAMHSCKTIIESLAGNQIPVWQGEQQTEQKGVQWQITLDFTLQGQPPAAVSQAICIYGLSSQDMDYRNTMGEYANTPQRILINGSPIPERDLMQAINLATATTAKAVGKDTVRRGQAFLQWINQPR